MGYYAVAAGVRWKGSEVMPSSCVALAQIVNLPQKFTSSHPYFVVPQTEWIQWYVRGPSERTSLTSILSSSPAGTSS